MHGLYLNVHVYIFILCLYTLVYILVYICLYQICMCILYICVHSNLETVGVGRGGGGYVRRGTPALPTTSNQSNRQPNTEDNQSKQTYKPRLSKQVNTKD
jgi:hypothetical protein